MQSTALFFHLIFILAPFFPLPTLSQPMDWDDRYFQRVPLTPEIEAAVGRPFARLTRRMNARPQAYGNEILFRHFYHQLADCTTTTNGEQHLTEACGELLTFIWDLDLMPGRYRRNFQARNEPFEVQWRHLNAHWLAYYHAHPGGQLQMVTDHSVQVPPVLVPLLNDPLHLNLEVLPNGGGAITSYSSLMDEFLRNQAVYATKVLHLQRKRVAFHHQTEHSTKRLLKLRAIFMLAVGENFDVLAKGNAAGAQVEQQQQQQRPPPPPPVEEAVVEEEKEKEPQQQQDLHQNEAPATLASGAFSDHLYETLPFVPNMDDLMSVLDEHPIGGGGEDDGIENDDQEEDELNNWLGEFLEPGDLQMRSMSKKSVDNQFVKMASSLMANRSLVASLLTLGFIGALIAIIWTLYSVYGSNSSQQKDEEEATTSSTTMITNDGV
ncbi:hypothetical protein TYRP_006389 [Tyrophagus putrescentiae]|nr:hypothetical protein TYRP_006389 [Tyrophagus putrescentiae]